MKLGTTRTRLLTACGLALAITGVYCAAPDATNPRQVSASAKALSPEQASIAAAKGSLPHGVRRADWVATVHTNAMQEGMARRAEFRALDQAGRCTLIAEIIRHQLPEIARSSGINRADHL